VGLDVVDDVHDLQDQARVEPGAAPTLARGVEQQGPQVGLGHRIRDVVAQVVGQVAQGVDLQLPKAHPVLGIVGVELVEPDVSVDFFFGLEVEPVPVDHRTAAQHQAQGVDVVDGEAAERNHVRGRVDRDNNPLGATDHARAPGSRSGWPVR
jgi:hypothetical protein